MICTCPTEGADHFDDCQVTLMARISELERVNKSLELQLNLERANTRVYRLERDSEAQSAASIIEEQRRQINELTSAMHGEPEQ